MEILSVKDQEDGSAIVELEMSKEENDFLVEYAIIDILKKQIERTKDEHGSDRSGS